jgi:hypothetical protein
MRVVSELTSPKSGSAKFLSTDPENFGYEADQTRLRGKGVRENQPLEIGPTLFRFVTKVNAETAGIEAD